MPMLYGNELRPEVQQDALRTFVHRMTRENALRHPEHAAYMIAGGYRLVLISDEEWLRRTRFHVTREGRLDRRHSGCETVTDGIARLPRHTPTESLRTFALECGGTIEDAAILAGRCEAAIDDPDFRGVQRSGLVSIVIDADGTWRASDWLDDTTIDRARREG